MSDLLYSDVEESLRSSVRDLLTDRADWASVLTRTETEEPYDPALWSALTSDLGLTGLPITEADGGQGASWRETAVVAEELGRSVAATPYLGSAVLATALAIRLGDSDLLRGLATGEQTATLAVSLSQAPGSAFPVAVRHDGAALTGTIRSVADAFVADTLLVPSMGPTEPALFRVDVSSAQLTPVVSLDLTRPLVDVSFDAATGEQIGSGHAAAQLLDAALTTGAAILASEQLGAAQRCLDLTVEYLKTRHQFGRPIGSFQALKHRVADVWAGVTQARAVARYAADCLARDDPDASVAASLAQAYCGPVAVKAAEECVQLHGGIGFTWEHPVHLYLKRAKADAIALGTARAHRARLGGLLDLPTS